MDAAIEKRRKYQPILAKYQKVMEDNETTAMGIGQLGAFGWIFQLSSNQKEEKLRDNFGWKMNSPCRTEYELTLLTAMCFMPHSKTVRTYVKAGKIGRLIEHTKPIKINLLKLRIIYDKLLLQTSNKSQGLIAMAEENLLSLKLEAMRLT